MSHDPCPPPGGHEPPSLSGKVAAFCAGAIALALLALPIAIRCGWIQ